MIPRAWWALRQAKYSSLSWQSTSFVCRSRPGVNARGPSGTITSCSSFCGSVASNSSVSFISSKAARNFSTWPLVRRAACAESRGGSARTTRPRSLLLPFPPAKSYRGTEHIAFAPSMRPRSRAEAHRARCEGLRAPQPPRPPPRPAAWWRPFPARMGSGTGPAGRMQVVPQVQMALPLPHLFRMLPFDSSLRPPAWDRGSQISQLLRRILRLRQLDMEYAGTQLVLLCWTPAKVCVRVPRRRRARFEVYASVDPLSPRYKMTAWRKRAPAGPIRDGAFLVACAAAAAHERVPSAPRLIPNPSRTLGFLDSRSAPQKPRTSGPETTLPSSSSCSAFSR